MRICKIEDMDVVAHTGAIASVIVFAKHIDLRGFTQGRIEDARDKMRMF